MPSSVRTSGRRVPPFPGCLPGAVSSGRAKTASAFLAEPHIAVVACTAPDGAPHAVPTWYEYKSGKVTFHTDTTAFKYKCLEHDPRIAFVVDTKKAPYKTVKKNVANGLVVADIESDVQYDTTAGKDVEVTLINTVPSYTS